MLSLICRRKPRLLAANFVAGDTAQVEQLRRMGVRVVTMSDGRVQLLHTATDAATPEEAEEGMIFMQDMIELSKTQSSEGNHTTSYFLISLCEIYTSHILSLLR